MKYDKRMIRKAIKARIDKDNEWNLYGRGGYTRWDARLPEHHFYMRNNDLALMVFPDHGEVVDGHGNVVCRYERKWSAHKTCLTYKELMPSIQWA